MRPRRTVYRLASTLADYAACYELLHKRTVYPTVMAVRDGALIGAVGTQPFEETNEIVVCGPLETTLERPGVVAVRLVEAYEAEMARRGVVAYWFHVDRGNEQMKKVQDHWGSVPAEEGPHGWWYRKDVPGMVEAV